MILFRYCLPILMISVMGTLRGQEGFSNQTRALYILDISRYVRFDNTFGNDPHFVISLLDDDDTLYWELEAMSRTRKELQGKPIRIYLYKEAGALGESHVVFVNSQDGYHIEKVLEKIAGKNTLLISEGYPFRTSMINFVVLDGRARFEANEELMRREGLYVNELFLAQAVKTREDWETLYEVTEDELAFEKGITDQQYILIERQMEEIGRQESMIMAYNEVLESLRHEVSEREVEIVRKSEVLSKQELEISSQRDVIAAQQDEVRDQRNILIDQEMDIREKQKNIHEQESLIRQKEDQIVLQDQKIVLQAAAIQTQKIIIFASALALLLLFGLVYFIWINYRNKQKANLLLQAQRDQIAYQKKHITDSIEYARRIQAALLPSMELFTDRLEHFVLFKPRDIVSGDFYWVEEINGMHLVVAADCTGHGVPGAFMSMLGVGLLNEIVMTEGIVRPDSILNRLREKIIDALKQEKDSIVKDGMDMTVCLIDSSADKLWFSGANNPLYHIRNGDLHQVKGDKMPVAIHEVMEEFTLHEISLEPGDTLYTFSDGYADQFGGAYGKKFLVRNFRELLLRIQHLPMIQQGIHLNEAFEEYREKMEQVDDVVVIGIRYRATSRTDQ